MGEEAQAQKISLYYRSGASDKEYHLQLEPEAASWRVNFQYGRRGSTLNSGTKTQTPVDYERARKIYDKIVKEKMAEGYTPGEEGTPFVAGDTAERVSGLVPQLPVAIKDDDTVEDLIMDPEWFMQEKMDGRHLIVRASQILVGEEPKIEAINRKGLVIGFPQTIESGVAQLISRAGPELILDGEAIGDVYYVFDLIKRVGTTTVNEKTPALERHQNLELVMKSNHSASLKLVPRFEGQALKRRKYEAIQDQQGEGVVFKRSASLYTPGRPASGGDMRKRKFTCDHEFVVAQVNDKRSVALKTGDNVAVGNCTIPASYEIPQVGDIVRVEYLYAFPQGSLFLPQYKGVRKDKSYAAWHKELKFKTEAGAGSEAEQLAAEEEA